jgi:hypothetical protein
VATVCSTIYGSFQSLYFIYWLTDEVTMRRMMMV